MPDSEKKLSAQKEVSYQLENRQFVVHRQFGAEKTLAEIVASEISQGVLQNKSLNDTSSYGIMEA